MADKYPMDATMIIIGVNVIVAIIIIVIAVVVIVVKAMVVDFVDAVAMIAATLVGNVLHSHTHHN